MEIETRVESYRVDKKCDKCIGGLMYCTGVGITKINTDWEHKCNRCDTIVWFENKAYPMTIFKDA